MESEGSALKNSRKVVKREVAVVELLNVDVDLNITVLLERQEMKNAFPTFSEREKGAKWMSCSLGISQTLVKGRLETNERDVGKDHLRIGKKEENKAESAKNRTKEKK